MVLPSKSYKPPFGLGRYSGLVFPAVLAFFLSGCAGFRPKMDDSINYQRDLRIKVDYWNGKKYKNTEEFRGVGVAKQADKYKIRVFPLGEADMITLTNCHREWKLASPKNSWKNGVEFEYEPNGLEKNRNCPMDIGIYEKKKGRHGWGMLEFEDDRLALNSKVTCNGSVKSFKGVSVCQAKEGLEQRIAFEAPVDFETIVGCEIKGKPGDKVFDYIVPEGDCTVHFCAFKKKAGDKQCSRHTMFGYQIIPIRGID